MLDIAEKRESKRKKKGGRFLTFMLCLCLVVVVVQDESENAECGKNKYYNAVWMEIPLKEP